MTGADETPHRRRLIIGNWKMNTTLAEAMTLATAIKEGAGQLSGVDLVICPPFPWLVPVAEILATHRQSALHLGAQNIAWQSGGAYTGEVSAAMLKGIVDYAIIGHSERRRYCHETGPMLAKKIRLSLDNKIKPVLCVGELTKPTAAVLRDPTAIGERQFVKLIEILAETVDHLTADERSKLVVAYEPVWAISANSGAEPADPHYVNAAAAALAEHLPSGTPILYGGSVNSTNAGHYLAQAAIAGLLVGGASLKATEFLKVAGA